jgi:predicted transcriptional regulator
MTDFPPTRSLRLTWNPAGEALQRFRLRVGWTQRELAEELGCTPGMVALVEQGKRCYGLEMAMGFVSWARQIARQKRISAAEVPDLETLVRLRRNQQALR